MMYITYIFLDQITRCNMSILPLPVFQVVRIFLSYLPVLMLAWLVHSLTMSVLLWLRCTPCRSFEFMPTNGFIIALQS